MPKISILSFDMEQIQSISAPIDLSIKQPCFLERLLFLLSVMWMYPLLLKY